MLDGKLRSGGNTQRENFKKKTFSAMPDKKGKPEAETKGADAPAEENDISDKTEITHNEDGTHTVKHSDGETSEHPTLGHAIVAIHSKHEGGENGHIHAHEAGATTHHAGMTGETEGPHEHASPEEAAEHLKGVLTGDGGDAMANAPMHPMHGGVPPIY